MRVYVRKEGGAETGTLNRGVGGQLGYPPTVPPFPQDVLDRHQARILQPGSAPLLAGQQPLLPTAYRAGVLLMHDSVRHRETLPHLNRLLSECGAGCSLDDSGLPGQGDGAAPRLRPVAVRQLSGSGPGRVDAWATLQNLRAAMARGDRLAEPAAIGGIGLDHLLVGSGVGGPGSALSGTNLVYEGSSGLSGVNLVYEGSGAAPAGSGSYGGRFPVDLALPVPVWPPSDDRRPTVAILDTGITAHPWFADGFLEVAHAVQAEVDACSAASGLPAWLTIDGAEDAPVSWQPLVGTLASHYGHGTFIAGIIRQHAPMARALAVRIMRSDGVAYESDLICALHAIAGQTRKARSGDPDAVEVDVVTLSLGYFHEDGEVTSAELIQAFDELSELGVVVVAAAGNFATNRPFYPAALAPQYPRGSGAPLVSVGALNPNGSVAMFSDDAPWVTSFATGAAVVSTYPTTSAGSQQPGFAAQSGRRQSLDGDDFSSGFAVWSGTSFAAPAAAATIARALADNGRRDPALRLGDPAAAVERAVAALAVLERG